MANISLSRDNNRVTVLGGTSNADGVTPVAIYADPITHRLLVDLSGTPGTGTVTSVSVVSANGFAGTVATATTTPAITLSTTITGILKGNGTAISAATAGTDYLVDITGLVTAGTGVTITGAGTSGSPYVINATGSGSGITSINTDTTAAQTLSNGNYIPITDNGTGDHSFAIDIAGLTSDVIFQGDVITFINNSGSLQVDLTSQVTGVLPLANGGTGSSLTDPNYDALVGWDDTDNSVSFWHIGSGLSYDHATHTLSSTGGGSGYDTIENNGTPVAQETTINLSTLLTASDNAGKTDLTINVANLASDATFLSNLDLGSISGQIDLSTQVTGTLGLSNGGTGASLSDPNYNAIMGWDDTDNAVSFWHIGNNLSYNHSTHTLSAVTSTLNVTAFDDFLTHYRITNSTQSYLTSGNFAYPSSTQLLPYIANHPGVIRVYNSTLTLSGFGEFIPSGGPVVNTTSGNINTSNDFNLAILNRINYTSNTNHNYQIQLVDSVSTNDVINLNTLFSTASFTVTLEVNNSSVSISAPSKPVTSTWFPVLIDYTGGVLTITYNGTTIYTATVTLNASGTYVLFNADGTVPTNGSADIDYVKYNYTVTR